MAKKIAKNSHSKIKVFLLVTLICSIKLWRISSEKKRCFTPYPSTSTAPIPPSGLSLSRSCEASVKMSHVSETPLEITRGLCDSTMDRKRRSEAIASGASFADSAEYACCVTTADANCILPRSFSASMRGRFPSWRICRMDSEISERLEAVLSTSILPSHMCPTLICTPSFWPVLRKDPPEQLQDRLDCMVHRGNFWLTGQRNKIIKVIWIDHQKQSW